MLAFEGGKPGLDEAIRQRFEVVHRLLWPQAPGEFFRKLAVPFVLGQIPRADVPLVLVQGCLNRTYEEVIRLSFGWYIFCIGLTYVNRLGGRRPRVTLGVSPERRATGYMDLVDFTPEELETILGEASKAHGLPGLRKLGERFTQVISQEPEHWPDTASFGKPVPPDHPFFVASEEAKSAFRIRTKVLLAKMPLAGC